MSNSLQRERSAWTDWGIALAATGLALALRIPFRSQLPYHWDSAEFALAISDFNIVHSQPHAPGYFLYVMLGRLVNVFLGDPHASLVWLSTVAGSALVGVMYWLGRQLFDRRTGIIAALLALTSPQTWFHSEVALTYIVDALLVCLTMLICWRAMQRGGKWRDAVAIGALLAVVGGVRQQSVPALGPVILYVFWRFEKCRLAKLLTAAVTSIALGMAWFWPMIVATGGWGVYFEIVRRHAAFNAPATWMGGGLDALVWNNFFGALYCFNGLILAAVPLLVMTLRRKWQWKQPALQLLAVWVGGMWIMGTFIGFIKQPGYVLNFLPGLFLLAASVLAQERWFVTLVVCIVNVLAFAGWEGVGNEIWFGPELTAREIRVHDRQLGDTVAAIRRECIPGATIVCHTGENLHFGLKQFQLLMPDFEQIQLSADPTMLAPHGKPLMETFAGRLQFVSGVDWNGKPTVVLVVPPEETPKIFESRLDVSDARPLLGGNAYIIPSPARRRP